MSEFLRQLGKVYKQPIRRDIFGKRDALPTEIKKAIKPDKTLEEDLDDYLPDDEDINDKENN